MKASVCDKLGGREWKSNISLTGALFKLPDCLTQKFWQSADLLLHLRGGGKTHYCHRSCSRRSSRTLSITPPQIYGWWCLWDTSSYFIWWGWPVSSPGETWYPLVSLFFFFLPVKPLLENYHNTFEKCFIAQTGFIRRAPLRSAPSSQKLL